MTVSPLNSSVPSDWIPLAALDGETRRLNLELCSRVHPRLHAKLIAQAGRTDLIAKSNGGGSWQLAETDEKTIQPFSGYLGREPDATALAEGMKNIPGGTDLWYLCGVGGGEFLRSLYEWVQAHNADHSRPRRGIVVLERDPGRLLLAASLADMRPELSSMSVFWVVGDAMRDGWERLAREKDIAWSSGPHFLLGYPVRQVEEKNEYRELERHIRRRIGVWALLRDREVDALVAWCCEERSSQAKRLWTCIPPDLPERHAQRLRRFADILRQHGWEVRVAEEKPDRYSPPFRFFYDIMRWRPTHLLLPNRTPVRVLAADLRALPFARVAWYPNDPSATWMPAEDEFHLLDRVLIEDESYASFVREKGAVNVETISSEEEVLAGWFEESLQKDMSQADRNERCWLCGSEEKRFYASLKNDPYMRLVGYPGRRTNFVVCPDCGLVRQYPMTDERTLERLATGINIEATLTDLDERVNWCFDNVPRIEGKTKRLWEIGCAGGRLCRRFMDVGWEATGCEPAPELAAEAEALGVTVWRGFAEQELESHPDARFEMIVFFHVLEHLLDPLGFLLTLKERLSADGCLYLEVPNILEPWGDLKDFFPAFHLHVFSSETLAILLERAGFRVVAETCTPNLRVIAKPSPDASSLPIRDPSRAEAYRARIRHYRSARLMEREVRTHGERGVIPWPTEVWLNFPLAWFEESLQLLLPRVRAICAKLNDRHGLAGAQQTLRDILDAEDLFPLLAAVGWPHDAAATRELLEAMIGAMIGAMDGAMDGEGPQSLERAESSFATLRTCCEKLDSILNATLASRPPGWLSS